MLATGVESKALLLFFLSTGRLRATFLGDALVLLPEVLVDFFRGLDLLTDADFDDFMGMGVVAGDKGDRECSDSVS